ncbi:MAG: hypothetical protein J6W04_00115 [Bacteroidales bacterium]|nr:hypothetical protein [Bacteroidales bacterium]
MDYLLTKKKAMLMGANVWYLPGGFDSDKCLAAYKFIGAGTEANSLVDCTGHGFDLKKSHDNNKVDPVWSNSGGWNGAHDSTLYPDNMLISKSVDKSKNLCKQPIKSMVVRYANGRRPSERNQGQRTYLACPRGSYGIELYYCVGHLGTDIFSYFDDSNSCNISGFAWGAGTSAIALSNALPASGVVGMSRGNIISGRADPANPPGIYRNGVNINFTRYWETEHWIVGDETFGGGGSWNNHYPVANDENYATVFRWSYNNPTDNGYNGRSPDILAAAFYSVELTQAQHAEVAEMMLALTA